MSTDIYSKHGSEDGKLEALARKCRLNAEDEERSLSVYQGMIEAIADCVNGRGHREATPAVVYVAAYQHGFGVDLSTHASRDGAEARLLSIAWQQCMRDPMIRAAVDARFGPLVSEEPPLEPPFEADLHRSEDRDDEGADLVSFVEIDPSCERHGLRPTAVQARPAGEIGRGADCRHEDDAWRESFGEERFEERFEERAEERAGERLEERRRTFCEKLLEEWPTFARGELLWIAECSLEQDEDVVVDARRRADAESRDGDHPEQDGTTCS